MILQIHYDLYKKVFVNEIFYVKNIFRNFLILIQNTQLKYIFLMCGILVQDSSIHFIIKKFKHYFSELHEK